MKTLQIRDLEEIALIPERAQSVELYLSKHASLTAAHLDLLPASLHELSLSFPNTDDVLLRHVAQRFTSLRALTFCAPGSSLAPLAALKDLRSLTVYGAKPLSGLSALTQLTSLDLSQNDPATIAQLPELTALQELHLEGKHFPVGLARALAHLPAFHTFRHGSKTFSFTRDPDAIAILSTSSSLRFLKLGRSASALSSEEVGALRDAPSLTELTAVVTDADQIRAIMPLHASIDRLRLTLTADQSPSDNPPVLIDAEMINLVASMTNLVALDVIQPHAYPERPSTYGADDLARLGALKRLERLHIANLPPHIPGADLTWLPLLPVLRQLVIGSKTLNAKLADHLKGCKSLRTLCLQGEDSKYSGEVQFGDGAFKKLAHLKLEALRVKNKKAIGPVSASHLASIPSLRILELDRIKDAAVAAFANHPSLERFKAETENSDKSGSALITLGAPPALWRLQLSGSGTILKASTAAALRAMPSLLNINNIEQGADLLAGHALATSHTGFSSEDMFDQE